MESFLFAINTVAPVVLVTATGYFMARFHIMTRDFADQLSGVVYSVLLPLSIFKEIYHQRPERIDLRFIAIVLAVLTAAFLGLIFLSPKIFPQSPAKAAAFAQLIFRCNYTIIGIPLLQNMFTGSELLPAYMVMPFTIAYFNAGAIVLLSLCNRTAGAPIHPLRILYDALTSPCVLAVLAACGCVFLHIGLPSPIEKTVNMIGSTGSCIALIALGGTFDPRQAVGHLRTTLGISLGRLLLLPALFLPAAVLLGLRGGELATLLLLLATPCAASSYPVAKKMGADGTITAETVLFTHLLCGVTLFFWIFSLRAIGLI